MTGREGIGSRGGPQRDGDQRRRGQSKHDADRCRRGQSHVIGVVLLLGVTTIALGGLTAAVGSIVEANAAGVDAGRVADGFDDALAPSETTGRGGGSVSFTEGRVRVAERTVRVLNDSGVVAERRADALVYESGDHQVTALSGAVVRGPPGNAVLYAEPPISVSDHALVVGIGVLGADQFAASGGGRLTIRTTVQHERTELGHGSWRVAVETATPTAWERYFERRGATTNRRDFDDDGTTSVVARFPGGRHGYLVVHDLDAEVEFRAV